MMKKSLFVAFALTATVANNAHAQGDVPPVAADQNASTGTAPEVFKKGTMGLSFEVPSGGITPGYAISLTYFLDPKTAIDFLVGFDLKHTPEDLTAMPPTASATTFALTAGLGYRMYKRNSGRIHTYLEPFGLISSGDLGKIGDNVIIAAGADLGVECMFTDWFSIRGQVGVNVNFSNKFKNIELGTATSGLFATMYWD